MVADTSPSALAGTPHSRHSTMRRTDYGTVSAVRFFSRAIVGTLMSVQ